MVKQAPSTTPLAHFGNSIVFLCYSGILVLDFGGSYHIVGNPLISIVF